MRRPCARQEHPEPEETETMRCISCEEEQVKGDAGTCKDCYEEVSATVEELKREIEDLKAKVAYLRSGARGPGFADAVLVAAVDVPNGEPSMLVPADRSILVSRSPVFKAMLENEMEESQSGTIKISDMSCDALRAFVDYLSVEAWLDEQMACELLVLAEKYQVVHLKAYCEMILVSKLNWNNSIIKYAFAHQHNAKHLLEAALCLMMDNMYKFPEHPKYPELVKKDSRLVTEIYQAFITKLYPNNKSDGEFSLFRSQVMEF
ncbi:BTB/POZ domain-containing protein At4g08455-like [Rhodamnia argentea]|uniref:BTB/POZ domain-containing protein At4g08455-like n=1 Tax=Rhodamnia argentea TaxID=178133 RepID=A0ABM3H3Z0_9MYRT|nr:BTB/POZ domain-containing protein At4g08455-like [Rhodamnia argentea]